MRAVPVVEARKLRSEAKGKGQNPDARPARYQKMAKLMEENDDGEYEQEGNYIPDQTMA